MNQKIHIQDDQEQDSAEILCGDERTDLEPQPHGDTPTTSADEDELAKRLEQSERMAQDHYDRLLRVSAEFDNYKKRTAREMRDVIRFAAEKLAGELLTVVDNLERAIESAVNENGDDAPLVKGVRMTLNDMLKILEKHHVTPIQALGSPFDPARHQAMMQEVSQDHPPNTVVRELQKGYLIHDRLLRPTMVTVSAAGDPSEKNQE